MQVGFLHVNEGARRATIASLEAHGFNGSARHVVDAGLVDTTASSFPITSARYEKILGRARQMSADLDRLILTCSVYNGIASDLERDLGIPVERSDAAAVSKLRETSGAVGILVSFPPTQPVVTEFVERVLAGQRREIRSAVANDASPFTTAPQEYHEKLVAALAPLQGCNVLLVAQYTMYPALPILREAWEGAVVLDSLEEAVLRLRRVNT